MFDYACITTIHDYLKLRFPGAFVRGYAGAITRFGDAHVFEVGEADDTVTLTIAHLFLLEHKDAVATQLDHLDIPAKLRKDGWVVVRSDGSVEAVDRNRLHFYAGSVGLKGRPSQRPGG